jgi:hypothetical protein
VGRVLGALDGNTVGPNLRCLSTFLSVLRASVVIKAPKTISHEDTENTDNPVGREIKTLPEIPPTFSRVVLQL